MAAGGIMNGTEILTALQTGAVAAQMGTAFVACDESAASPVHRVALVMAETAMMRSISGRPARGVVNRFTELDTEPDRPAVPAYPYAYDAGKTLDAAARSRGESGYGAFRAGQGAARTRPIRAACLMTLLSEELRNAATPHNR
ncbi:NAD(P)H-dependent flavin oxidoreductase [Acetobacter oeni]|uniref:NAD(P)H-dependent flavin oxidoreductase n=1 Tax=Acetobacter oeni TaxID=304077 RepID=UPI0021BF9C7F|nr:nitronate monooxygenase [Acetobacter oeni]